jgi:hypothetical protein
VASYDEPRGTGGPSYVEHGTCPVDRSNFAEEDDENNDGQLTGVRKFAFAQLHSYELHTHGWFFWNFRTELEDRWDYQRAVKNGWLPTQWKTDGSEPLNTIREELESVCPAVSPAPSPKPPPPSSSSSAWKVTLIRWGVGFFLVTSFGLLLFIFVPTIIDNFRIVRSGYVRIREESQDHMELMT